MRNGSNHSQSTPRNLPLDVPLDLPASEKIFEEMRRTHRRYARSYKTNQRKTKMFKLAKRVAWALFAADVWFSFLGIRAFSGSLEFALFIAAFVGAGQWVVSEALLSRSLGPLMKIDADKDGEITISEWVRWGIHFSGLITVYGIDIVTNLAAINGDALGRLPYTIAGDAVASSVPGWVAWITSLFICAILCFSDEWIHSISDARLAELEEEQPALKERAFLIEAKLREAGEFGVTVLNKAAERGVQRGQAY